MKKRFDEETRKKVHANQSRIRVSNSDESSDMVNLKRVRFKDSKAGEDHPPSCVFDDCSVPCEAAEPPQSSSDAKTSEYAAFKKLKQSISRTSCLNQVGTERIRARKFRASNNLGELDDMKLKDAKSSIFAEKSTIGDVYSFKTRKDAALESADMAGKIHDDHERSKASFLIRTPTTVDLASFLSTTANASEKPEGPWKDGDVFSCKRRKLRQHVAKTLFPETEELPKECDLVSLLLRRLLPESSENTLETNDKFQLHPSPDSSCQFKENWDTSLKAKSPTVEGIEPFAIRCANRIHLGYTKKNEGESSFNDRSGSECLSNRYGIGNLLTWSNDDYEYSTELRSNRFEDRNLLMWSNDEDVLKHEVHDRLSYDGVNSHDPFQFRDRTTSYGVPSGDYGYVAANDAERTNIKHKDEGFNCKFDRSIDGWCNSAHDVSFGKSGISELSKLGDYGEIDYLNNSEMRRQPYPLLLGWGTDVLDMQESRDSRDTNGMVLDIYSLPSRMSIDDHHIPEDSLHLPWYGSQDHHSQRHHLDDQNDLVARSRHASFALSWGLEQQKPDDSSFFKNIFRDGSFFFLPQIHHPSAINMECERNRSSVEALLLIEGIKSDLGLKIKSLTEFSDMRNDFSTNDLFQFLKQENRSSDILIENENNLEISRPEHWPLLMDAEVETYNVGGESPTACGNVTW